MDVRGRITLLKGLRIVLVIVLILVWYDADFSALVDAVVLGLVSGFGLSIVAYTSIVIAKLEDLDDFLN